VTNALAVVAHHDDHLLFMGGTMKRLAETKGWKWTVIAMCLNPDFQKYYCDSCADLKAEGKFMHFKDDLTGFRFTKNSQQQMEAELLQAAGGTRFDWVFTHSRHPRGEYGGHRNHEEVQHVVTSLVRRGHLTHGVGRLAYFSYQVIEGHTVCTASFCESWRTHYLPLTYDEQKWKLHWMSTTPDSLRGLADPCPSLEAFEGDGLQLPRPVA
jgi:LmbE family N-acetylglucosaminyl deacetylase